MKYLIGLFFGLMTLQFAEKERESKTRRFGIPCRVDDVVSSSNKNFTICQLGSKSFKILN